MTVCYFFMQGNCRNGDRCRFEHTGKPDYSHRRNDYSYQERYKPQQYSQDASYGPGDWYNKQQRYTYSNRYDSNQQYSDRNQQYSDRNQQHHERNYSNNNVWHGGSYYERHPSGSNYYSNKYESNRNEWTSQDYKKNSEYKTPRNSSTVYNGSTPKSNTNFSFKEPSFPKSNTNFSFKEPNLPKKDDSADLYMDETNMTYAEVMRKDALEWESGNMWPYTSYCPISEKPSFPGFFDISAEELRRESYKAKEKNSYSSYIEFVKKATLLVESRRNQMKDPSVKLMSTIDKYRRGECSSSENIDSTNLLSLFDNNTAVEEMIADEQEVSQRPTASTFSFKTTLETDNAVKTSASSFSFKLPPDSKWTEPDGSSDLYTSLDKLSLQDKEQFSASMFTLGRIPTVPPPQTMCF